MYYRIYDLKKELGGYLATSEKVPGDTLVKKIYSLDPESHVVEKLASLYNLKVVTSAYWKENFSHLKLQKIYGDDNPFTYVLKVKDRKEKIIAFIVDPTDFLEIFNLKEKYGAKIEFYLVTKKGLEEIKTYINQSMLEFDPSTVKEDAVEELSSEEVLDDEIVRFVNRILEEAVRRKASDIHFEVYEKEMIIKYRLDGVLYAYQKVDKSRQNKIISRLKIMSGLNISQTRIPQDGRFSMKVDNFEVNFRVSILPSIFGETAVVRILSGYQFNYSLERIGLETNEIDILKKALSSAGMILVSGPTGSGKTTTLYAAINEIKNKGYKIITIEDPVEYDIEGIVQIAVNEKVGMTFSEGLRSIVRQDPDVIMVGEIRDKETANIAVNAALTGHLVLSTVHANSPFDTLMRIQRLEVPPYQLVSALSVVIFQRLVRKLCNSCKKEFIPDEYYLNRYKNYFSANEVPSSLYKASGCENCYFTGYEGRIGVFEVVDFTSIRMELYSRENYKDWKEVLDKHKVMSIKERTKKLIDTGITTLEEVERSLI